MTGKWFFNPFISSLDYYNSLSSTNYTGTNCTGADGDINRTLSTSGVTMIIVDGMHLHPTVDYTTSSNTITFLNQIFNEQRITIWN